LDELLSNPAVQVGVAPLVAALVVALIVALLLRPLQLGGLAVAAAFLTTMYLVSGLAFSPLTATRKIIIVSIAAPVVGILIDVAFKPTRIGAVVLALCAAAGALWVFWPVLAQKPAAEGWLLGASTVVVISFMVGFSQLYLAADAVRAGAAGLGLGLATGVAAILSASATYGLYGIALGAGAGGFLLPQMITGKKGFAGATFTLPAMLIGGLVAAGTMVLAKLPWYALLVLALVPVGARLPAPGQAPVWLQAVLLSLYCFVIGAAACALAWAQGRSFDLGFMSLQL
jgi:hypothetical protein